MARRYHEIKGLAEFTAKTIVSDEEQWKKFLHTAGHMYKYPFKEQMLIYAQRPDATACASLELWNEKMNCWVNKGAQGIALIDEEGVHRSGLKYVFDVKDVHEARFIGHKPNAASRAGSWNWRTGLHRRWLLISYPSSCPCLWKGASLRNWMT